MRNVFTMTLALIVLFSFSTINADQNQSTPNFAWANDFIYSAQYSSNNTPVSGDRNILYVFDGLKGQRPVAECGPGDPNYQGGRWQVVILEFTPLGIKAFDINNDGYSEFEITNFGMVQHYMTEHDFLKEVKQGPVFDAPLIRPKGLEPPDAK
jgi:hypothetical protein